MVASNNVTNKLFFQKLYQELMNKASKPSMVSAFRHFSAKFYNAPHRLPILLNSASSSVLFKNRAGSKIPVQPTAIARRKRTYTHGKGRVPAGRRAKQRPRNLSLAIKENRPNAKSHG